MNDSIAKLLLRIGFGGMMLFHGWPKLQKLIITGEFKFADPLGIGPEVSLVLTIFAEFLCAIFIMIGFRVKLSSIPLAITMLVAVLIVHINDGRERWELPLLYLFGYLALLFLGAGKYSIDYYFFGKKNR